MPDGIDIGQVIIIVIAVVAGFIQWAWKLYQNNQESRRRPAQPLSAEERQLREEAWRQQTGQAPNPPPLPRAATVPLPTRPPPQPTRPADDPWKSMRDIFETVKEEMRKAQEEAQRKAQPTPPPVPSPPPVRRAAVPPSPLPTTSAPRQPAPQLQAPALFPQPATLIPSTAALPSSAALALHPRMVTSSATPAARDPFAGLRAGLVSRDAVRQAIVLREILGPPKALQSSSDTPF